MLCRIVRAEGDPGISPNVKFSAGAIEAGINSLKAGMRVVTDVRMVEMGIFEGTAQGSGSGYGMRH